MELQVGVKILLKNPEGRYLLMRRNSEKYPELGGQWDLVGGRIEPGKSLLENLRREIKEETGLDYSGEPKLVAAQDILKDKHVVRLTYFGGISGEPKTNEESIECKWLSAEEISKLENLDYFFKELLEKKLIKL